MGKQLGCNYRHVWTLKVRSNSDMQAWPFEIFTDADLKARVKELKATDRLYIYIPLQTHVRKFSCQLNQTNWTVHRTLFLDKGTDQAHKLMHILTLSMNNVQNRTSTSELNSSSFFVFFNKECKLNKCAIKLIYFLHLFDIKCTINFNLMCYNK